MTKEQFDKQLLESESKLKSSVSRSELSQEEIVNRIKKLLERQPKDMQTITQLKYVDKYSVPEIAKILDKSEGKIYLFLQAIISDIDSIINLEAKDCEEKSQKEINLGIDFSVRILDIKG